MLSRKTIFPIFLAGAIVYLMQGILRQSPWTPAKIVEVAIGLPSLILWVIARVQLGSSFSVAPRATDLVTSGLYSRIRNPIYLFGGLTIASIFLLLGRPIFLCVFFVLIPLQYSRLKKEEKVLESKFGDTYRNYRSNTWF